MKTKIIVSLMLLVFATAAQAQSWNEQGYDDYRSFSASPDEMDEEVYETFGRFFMSSITLGTGIFTGSHAITHSSGFLGGMRFIYFVDRLWATELGGAYASHTATYNSENSTKDKVNLELDSAVIPLSFGLRFGFNHEALPRGFSSMNPYVVAAAEAMFRSETVKGKPILDALNQAQKDRYGEGAVFNSTGYGFAFGGGIEFDVYKNRMFLGVDLRYHQVFWPDSTEVFGTLGRSGNYMTILATGSYSY